MASEPPQPPVRASSGLGKRRADLALRRDAELPALLGMPGRLVTVIFRGTRVRVLADHDRAAQQARVAAPRPVTDLLHLELLTGAADAPGWSRPVAVHAVIEARADPLLAVSRASRWASYAARLAVVADQRLSDQVLLEAGLRGVWVAAPGADGQLGVIVTGQRGPAPGSVRGLLHRWLDELIWAALDWAPGSPVPGAAS